MIIFFIFTIFLIWGSFLNMLSYRLLHDISLFKHRSICPSCQHNIVWYDNIPVISWLALRAQCRSCKQRISWLYPFIELLTAFVLTAVFYFTIPVEYVALVGSQVIDLGFWGLYKPLYLPFVSYFIFFSALIVATRTDLEAMVIPQLFTLWLVPFGLVAACAGWLSITWLESLFGIALGYGLLWGVAFLFKRMTGKDGMGIGDMELLAMIGAFLGPLGVWISVMIASLSGLFLGALYLVTAKKDRATRIPFGPFLALGAALYFFYGKWFVHFIMGS